MDNPLEQAIESGVRANTAIGDSFARFGTSAHPRGFVLSAYRTAHRALITALREPNRLAAAQDVTRSLRQSLSSGIRSELADMQDFGQEEAIRQLGYYQVPPPPTIGTQGEQRTQLDAAVTAIMDRYDAQSSLVDALIISGASDEQITGDDERAGVLLPAAVIAAAVYWTAALTWVSFSLLAARQTSSYQFRKQAVAALDERTTDCCLKVHAQVQLLDDPFKLTGTPRYADKMDWPAFHYYCRTSGVLYLPEFDDGLSARMRDGADQIIRERAAGGTGERHPADAFG